MMIFFQLVCILMFALIAFFINLNVFAQFNRREIFGMLAAALTGISFSLYSLAHWFLVGPSPDTNPTLFIAMFMGGAAVFGIVAGLLLSQIIGKRYYADQVEVARLTNNLEEVRKRQKNVAENLKRERLNDSAHQSLASASRFLNDQEQIITLRINVLNYIIWENEMFDKYKHYLNLNYLKKNLNYEKVRRKIENLIKEANEMKHFWFVRAALNPGKHSSRSAPNSQERISIARQLHQRAAGLAANLDNMLTDITNYEALNTLKSIDQLEAANVVKQLPEANIIDAIETMNRFKSVPLDRELLFQHLRIKSLSELNEQL